MNNESQLALCDELKQLLSGIGPDDFVAPEITGVPNGARVLGTATDEMKGLWTLWSRLEGERQLGEVELRKRAVHVAISFEVGRHFNCWRSRIGINSSWQVFAVTSQ